MPHPTRAGLSLSLLAFSLLSCSSPATRNTGGTGGTGDEGDTGGAGTGTGGGGTGGAAGAGTSGAGASGGTGAAAGTGGAAGDAGAGGGNDDASSGGTVDAGLSADAELGPDADSEMNITGNGCNGGTCLNPDCKALGTPAAVGTFASIGFETHPTYIPNDVIIPTFDDVPDRPYTSADGALFKNFGNGDWTAQMLDWLDANKLHFDFFINTANFCYLDKYPHCVDTVTRILKTQNAGNHTVHHIHMGGSGYDPKDMFNSGCRAAGKGSMLTCEDEISGVEDVIGTLSNGGIPHLTRFRAPYGEPFQTGGGAVPEIQGVVSKFAVHVGWAMESGDADHDTDGSKLGSGFFVNAVTKAIGSGPGQGSWGVILMHGTYPWSIGELKSLFDPKTGYMATHKFRVGTVEDAICWKYGRHSWEVISQITGKTHGPN